MAWQGLQPQLQLQLHVEEAQQVQPLLQARLLLLISRGTNHLLQVQFQQPYLMLRHSNSALRELRQLQQRLRLGERQQQ
jgi:hypothetical protein